VLDREEICFSKERNLSKIKPRLRAEGHGKMGAEEGRESDGLGILSILSICCGSPTSMNSVLEGFRVRRLAAIQEEMVEMVDSSCDTAERKFLGMNEMKSWVSSA
jgi:hypothetical protein